MEHLISQSIQVMPVAAIPVVIVVLGLYWIYRKTMIIQKDRELTKKNRDDDSQKMHDEIISLRFELSTLKGRSDLHDDLIRDINKQISILNVNMAGISQKIDDIIYIMREVSK